MNRTWHRNDDGFSSRLKENDPAGDPGITAHDVADERRMADDRGFDDGPLRFVM